MTDAQPSPEAPADDPAAQPEPTAAQPEPTPAVFGAPAEGHESATSGSGAPASLPLPPAPSPARRPERGLALAHGLGKRLSRPRMQLALIGALLLAIAGLVVTGSAWTAPLFITGGLMIVTAWVGSRLDGRLALEWGASGAKLEFWAQINSAGRQPRRAVPAVTVARLADLLPEDAQVIEGEAHTGEIDIAELKTLIALLEASNSRALSAVSAANGSSPSSMIRRTTAIPPHPPSERDEPRAP